MRFRRLLPLHSRGVLRPHFLGRANAFVGLIPTAGRTDLYLQRQGRLAWRMTSQHFPLGGGGRLPVTAWRHKFSLDESMPQS